MGAVWPKHWGLNKDICKNIHFQRMHSLETFHLLFLPASQSPPQILLDLCNAVLLAGYQRQVGFQLPLGQPQPAVSSDIYPSNAYKLSPNSSIFGWELTLSSFQPETPAQCSNFQIFCYKDMKSVYIFLFKIM